MKRNKPSPISYPIQLQRNGQTYSGTYTVERRLITVKYEGLRETTQLGGLPAEVLARTILSELVGKSEGELA